MYKHYLKTIFRNLNKHKVNSGINILGLSLGLAIFLLIWIFILYETSYDKFLEDNQNIYRIHSTAELGQGEPLTIPAVMFPIAETAKREIPEVKNYVRFTRFYTNPEIGIDGKITNLIPEIIFADSTFFSVFDFDFLAGEKKSALNQLNSIVLTYESASRLFVNPLEAINRIITIRGEPYTITGVLEKLPNNTHMQFYAVGRQEKLPEGLKTSGMNFYAYLRLNQSSNTQEVESKLDRIVAEHVASNPVYEGVDFKINNSLINITDIHLHSNLAWEMKANGSYRNIVVFGLLGIFVLFIAIINYVNLATARSSLRSKELGIRKVVGATRKRLLIQILFESFLIALISFIIAIALTEVFSGFFESFLGVSLSTSVLLSVSGIVIILSLLLLTGILSGIYPAFFMSGFEPARIIKGEVVKGKKGTLLRQILVVFQFVITIFIISSLIIIERQLQHVKTANLGFDHDQVMVIRSLSPRLRQASQEVSSELRGLSQVKRVAAANFIYGGESRKDLIVETGVAKESGVTGMILTVDHNFFDLMGIEIIQGRNFLSNSQTDQQEAFILNQTAIKSLGFQKPLEKNIDIYTKKGPVVGVINDFFLKSLHQEIEPMAIDYSESGLQHVYLKVKTDDYKKLREDISGVLNSFDPSYVPDIVFLDERIQNLYQQEERSASLMSAGAFLAIIISILGVYGLASFSAERRIKEIGVRKILGASRKSLLWVFNKESLLLVLTAFIIAVPVAWLLMNQWLDNFVSRIQINLWYFIIPGILTLLLSSFIISMQTLRVSGSNPVKALRTE